MPYVWDNKKNTWVEKGGGSNDPSPKRKEKLETRKLQNSVNSQRKRVEAISGKKSKPEGDTVLERIFDVLSRGNYAAAEGIAEGTRQVNKKKTGTFSDVPTALGGFLKGAGPGLTGKKKTTFSNVLKENNVLTGKPAGIVGFGMDIVLDPTTYLGAGVVKSVGKGAVKAVGGKVLKEAAETVTAKTVARKAVASTIKENSALKVAGGKARTLTPKKLDRVAANARLEYAYQEATKAEAVYKAANKGRVELRVLGKPLVGSEKLYQGLAKVGEVIGKTDLGEGINKAFRTTAMFPGRLNLIKRMYESNGVAAFEDVTRELRSEFSAWSKADLKQINHAIEDGTDLAGLTGTKGADLGDAQQKIKAIYDDLWDSEKLELGLHPDKLDKAGKVVATEKLDKYVYHSYKNYKTQAAQDFRRKRRLIGSEAPGFEKERTIPTLREAEALGLKPVENAVDGLILRYAKHHQVKSRKQFVQAVENEFGVPLPKEAAFKAGKLGLVKGDSRFLSTDGIYFPPEVARSLKAIERLHDNDEAAQALLRAFDKIQGYWKFGATAANPGHHVRNLVGDMFLNYEDGVVNPLRYKQAMSVMRNRAKPGTSTLQIGQHKLDAERVWYDYVRSGGKSGFFRTEFATGIHKPVEMIRGISETREDFGRLAHFIDAYKKEAGKVKLGDTKGLIAASERAAIRVRKWNIDYGDLTDMEKQFAKRVVPFYTWLRKNLPLQLEALAMKPGRLAVIPKGQRAIENVLGTEQEETGMIIPRWIREMAPVALQGEGEGRNAIYWAPPLPTQDLSRFVEGGLEGAAGQFMSSVSPAVRIPGELAADKQFFSGAPIDSYKKYFSQQLPQGRFGEQLLKSTSGESELSPRIQLLNYLAGAGLIEVNEGRKQSELRRQQDPLQKKVRDLKEKKRKEMLSGR